MALENTLNGIALQRILASREVEGLQVAELVMILVPTLLQYNPFTAILSLCTTKYIKLEPTTHGPGNGEEWS